MRSATTPATRQWWCTRQPGGIPASLPEAGDCHDTLVKSSVAPHRGQFIATCLCAIGYLPFTREAHARYRNLRSRGGLPERVGHPPMPRSGIRWLIATIWPSASASRRPGGHPVWYVSGPFIDVLCLFRKLRQTLLRRPARYCTSYSGCANPESTVGARPTPRGTMVTWRLAGRPMINFVRRQRRQIASHLSERT
ncbi:hypothetical protein DAEQUDRAFT_400962 [Daedalea quercina L-15889]|uniref:Uncharacterized protein n=1 Tax=Daedalea quercina L-15889 TaxID=1314783 RepID=A0A165NQH3_9APHY|nr:hypothetical protein DAEQUDRAFT_400962 [Daedalea quercina L-15889]